MTAPIAAVVAGPEPDSAAKKAQPKTATKPKLPVTFPISDSAMLTIRLAIPPCSIRDPAKTNNGTVINGKGSTPVYIEFAIPAKSRSSIKYPITVPMETAIGIGTAKAIAITIATKTVKACDSSDISYA